MMSISLRLSACCLIFLLTGCAGSRTTEIVCEDPAVPMTHALGMINQAHYDAMQANGEAADFVIHRSDFEPESAELTSAGIDHMLEIGARMSGTPFPVIVERSEPINPQLDNLRRDAIAQGLSGLGNADAGHRTMVSRPYSDGLSGAEAVRQMQAN